MIQPKDLLKNIFGNQKEIKLLNERASIIKEFTDQINIERINTKYKKVSPCFIAVKLSHVKNNFDLYYFLSECKDYQRRKGSFSKMFFGKLKVK